MIDTIETVVRWLGGAGVVTAWILSGWAAAHGLARRPGRGSGLALRIGAPAAYLLVAVPYYSLCVVLWRPLPMDPSAAARWALMAIGGGIGAAGLTAYLWSLRALGDMYNVSSALGSELYAEHRFVTNGPYLVVRHPMYLGLILGGIGALLVYRTWTTVFIVACLPGVVMRARHEERLLAAEFGQAYEGYCRRVPRWWPRIRRPAPRPSARVPDGGT